MYNFKICDDDSSYLTVLKEMVNRFVLAHPELDCRVSLYSSPSQLLASICPGDSFTIYLLDIIMPGTNGIELGEKIRREEPTAIIIYLSTSPDYALVSYSVSAFQYLLKPAEPEMLDRVLTAAINQIDSRIGTSLVLKTREGIFNIAYHTISYLEYREHRVYCCLADGRDFSSTTLRTSFASTIAPLLGDCRFVQPHVSFLVNMDFISSMNPREFILNCGASIPISRKLYPAVKKKYMDFLLNYC